MKQPSETDARQEMAERLQAARVAAGFRTQTAMAEFLNISQQRYGGWERGEWLPNEVLLMRAMCDALDITADDWREHIELS